MTNNKKIAQNTTLYIVALSMQKILSFAYFIFVARMIGVGDIGKLTFALSFTTIFAIVLDFGLNTVLIRESARSKENSQKYLSNILGLKVIGAIIIYGVVILAVNLLGYPSLVIKMVFISGMVMVLDSFASSFFAVLRGHHILKLESLSVILNQLIVISFGVAVLKLNLGLVFLISAYLAGSFFNFIFSSISLKRKLNILPLIKFSKQIVIKLLKFALPFALAGIFVRLYSNMDIVLLSKLTNDYQVGLYSVAYKMAFALQFVGLATLASIYPAFCYYFVRSKEMLGKTFAKVLFYLTVISWPIAIGVIALADKIVIPVFGAEYGPSVMALQIMIMAIPMSFLSYPTGAMLNACNRQTTNTIILGLTATISIILNFIFIPMWGFIGSAIVVPISYGILFFSQFIIANKIVDYDKKYLLLSLGKVIASSAVMGLAVIYLKDILNVMVVVILGVLVYLAILYVLKGFSKHDFLQARELILKK